MPGHRGGIQELPVLHLETLHDTIIAGRHYIETFFSRLLASLLRDLAQQTRCKVLLTSRRDERSWLGNLPARVQLRPMPMRESLRLAATLAARHGHPPHNINWRPLLRYAAGNPLTITVLVGQALRESIASTRQIEAFVARLRAGEAQLEAEEDSALGRTRSLAASLSYGFARAFTHAERTQLAILHLFRGTADVDTFSCMGIPEIAGEDAVPELDGLTRDAAIALLELATGIGLLESMGSGFYQIHPALPWYFTTLFTARYGPPATTAAQRAARAYTKAIGILGSLCHDQAGEGRTATVVPVLRAEEANLRHALDLARANRLWNAELGCLQGLSVLYERTGRDSEWARLVANVTPDFTDPATDRALPGREDGWSLITSYRVRLARSVRDWPAATTLQNVLVASHRDQAAVALAVPATSLTDRQRDQIYTLGVDLNELGIILSHQGDPGCLRHFQEALALAQRTGDRWSEAHRAGNLGNAYVDVPGLRDLDQAEHWLQHSLSLRPGSDQLGRARCLSALGSVARERFDDARAAGAAKPVLLEHLNAAILHYENALELVPADDHQERSNWEHQLGDLYRRAGGYTGQALRHYQQAIQHAEVRGDIYGAGVTRYNIAVLLASDRRVTDALRYARAALDDFERAGPGAAEDAGKARQFIAGLKQSSR